MFASMHDGIFVCEGCSRTYPEYVNGCVEEHDAPRRVVLLVEDPELHDRAAGG